MLQEAKELHFSSPSSFFLVHKQCLLIFLICSRILGWSWIEHIVKVAMEARRELINETFPLYDISMNVAETLLSILSTKGIKSWTEGLVVPRGNPRYVNGMEAIFQPRDSAMSEATAVVILIGIREDL
jgi:hypothetical protein